MTYEEAKYKVTDDCSLCYLNDESEMCDDECEEYKTVLLEALNKQIPKKPLYKEETSIVFGKYKAPYCPCCGDSWNCDEFGNGMKYCWNCGQKISWTEEGEKK